MTNLIMINIIKFFITCIPPKIGQMLVLIFKLSRFYLFWIKAQLVPRTMPFLLSILKRNNNHLLVLSF